MSKTSDRLSMTTGLTGYVLAAAALGLTVIVHYWKGYPIQYLTRDPAATVQEAFVIGMLSNFGAILWSATLGVCVVGALGLASHPVPAAVLGKRPPGATFFAAGAALTGLLLFDDLFLAHEEIFPDYIGLPEVSLLVFEVLALGVLLFTIRGNLRRFESVFLVLALGFFVLSLGVDRIPEARLGAWHHLVEDGFKFLGITSWCLFWTTSLLTRLRDLNPD